MDSPLYSRRHLLAATGALTVGGCTGSSSSSGTTSTAAPSPSEQHRLDIPPAPDEGTEEHWSRYDTEWQSPEDSPLSASVETEVLVENLEIPWDLAFAPTGALFLTERTGQILRFEAGEVTEITEPSDAIDAGSLEPGSETDSWWLEGGEGGLLGIAVHPGYPDSSIIYAYYTSSGEPKQNTVVAFDSSAENPGENAEALVTQIPADSYHNGGRIGFGPAGYLWITTGDAGSKANAQDTSSLAGKILCLRATGEPAPINPDLGANSDPRVFSYGYRNPQGLSWLPDATPVVTEHGPGNHQDEVSLLASGENYGWPDVRAPGEYPSTDVHPPLLSTADAQGRPWAPSGCVFYTGDAVPAWRNRLVSGALYGQELRVTTLTQSDRELPPTGEQTVRYDDSWLDDRFTATVHQTLTNQLGRVRHVEQGPDGDLFAITSNRDGRADGEFPRERDDVLVRLTVADS